MTGLGDGEGVTGLRDGEGVTDPDSEQLLKSRLRRKGMVHRSKFRQSMGVTSRQSSAPEKFPYRNHPLHKCQDIGHYVSIEGHMKLLRGKTRGR